MEGAQLPDYAICPQEGDFIGWKQVQGNVVLKLLITGKRTSVLGSRKCRCNEAKVLDAFGTKGMTFRSHHDKEFTYTLGQVVSEPKYDDDIRVECAPGIHFFMTKEEAVAY